MLATAPILLMCGGIAGLYNQSHSPKFIRFFLWSRGKKGLLSLNFRKYGKYRISHFAWIQVLPNLSERFEKEKNVDNVFKKAENSGLEGWSQVVFYKIIY